MHNIMRIQIECVMAIFLLFAVGKHGFCVAVDNKTINKLEKRERGGGENEMALKEE